MKVLLSPRVLYLLALMLLLSFGMHLAGFHHDHPEAIYGDGVQAAFHGEDRKWNVILADAPLGVAEYRVLDTLTLALVLLFASLAFVFDTQGARLRDPLRRAFRSGILNPKTF